MRPLTATIQSPRGTPIEGELLVLAGEIPAQGITDAGGGVTIVVEVAVAQVEPYTLAIHAPVRIDGTLYLPGTLLRLEVTEGEDAIPLASCIVDVIDASLPTLLARLAALEGGA